MTEIVIAQDAPVLVVIDIARARHDVLIAIPGKKHRRRLTVLNQMENFQQLITSLTSYLLQLWLGQWFISPTSGRGVYGNGHGTFGVTGRAAACSAGC